MRGHPDPFWIRAYSHRDFNVLMSWMKPPPTLSALNAEFASFGGVKPVPWTRPSASSSLTGVAQVGSLGSLPVCLGTRGDSGNTIRPKNSSGCAAPVDSKATQPGPRRGESCSPKQQSKCIHRRTLQGVSAFTNIFFDLGNAIYRGVTLRSKRQNRRSGGWLSGRSRGTLCPTGTGVTRHRSPAHP